MTNFGRRFWVLAALSLGPAVATSFARFAYALILPAMRAELDLSYSQAGSLNTANALGYLVGALLCTHYVPRLGNRRLFSFGLVVTVLALLGAGLAESFGGQMALRAVAGMSSAMVYISRRRSCKQSLSRSAGGLEERDCHLLRRSRCRDRHVGCGYPVAARDAR